MEPIIDPKDLEVVAWPPQPIGGQHVGYTSRGVKITHTPSGLIAICYTERSLHRNRKIAMDMLLGGLSSPDYRAC